MPLMPFDILMCFLPFLFLPTSCRGPSSEIQLLLERNGFLPPQPTQLELAGLSLTTFPFHPLGRSEHFLTPPLEALPKPSQIPRPLHYHPTEGGHSGLLSSSSKLISILLWWCAGISPQASWTSTNSLLHVCIHPVCSLWVLFIPGLGEWVLDNFDVDPQPLLMSVCLFSGAQAG